MLNSEQLLKDMGQRIIKRRKQLRLTQEELAEKIDVTAQMISTAELGKKAIRPENMLKICHALDISADYLLTGEISKKDLYLICEKMKLLTPEQFRITEEIIINCLELCSNNDKKE